MQKHTYYNQNWQVQFGLGLESHRQRYFWFLVVASQTDTTTYGNYTILTQLDWYSVLAAHAKNTHITMKNWRVFTQMNTFSPVSEIVHMHLEM